SFQNNKIIIYDLLKKREGELTSDISLGAIVQYKKVTELDRALQQTHNPEESNIIYHKAILHQQLGNKLVNELDRWDITCAKNNITDLSNTIHDINNQVCLLKTNKSEVLENYQDTINNYPSASSTISIQKENINHF
ncbi:hypothetical protein, partial [Salmonella enterica]